MSNEKTPEQIEKEKMWKEILNGIRDAKLTPEEAERFKKMQEWEKRCRETIPDIIIKQAA